MLNDITDSKTNQEEISKTDIKIFESEEFGNITAIERDGEPWFIAKEIADILGYSRTNKMTVRLDDDEKVDAPIWNVTINQNRNQTIINEKGVISGISGCRKDVDEKAVSWILSLLNNKNYVPIVIRDEFVALKTIEQLIGCKLQRQFRVGPFKIDGYDSENNTAYEIDEAGHSSYDIGLENERELFIKNAIGCKFVRINL